MRYCSNGNTFKCTACPTSDCYYCGVNGKCTECSAAVDFRQMNNATMRCVPLPGYYESGVSQAAPCVPGNCLTCTSATNCLSCYAGKFLSGTACLVCMPNCANCTAASTCTACDPYYVFTGSACAPNCSEITACSSCTVGGSGVDCSACTTGYTLASNACSAVCGDGIRVSSEECDDGGTAPGGGCSATCTVETGYYCTDTFPSASVCALCIPFCTVCSGSTSCSTCSANYAYDNTTGACVIDCSVIAQCATCDYTTFTHCLTCNTGYEGQPNNTCAPRCGDGKRVASEECDDGDNVDNDGCSSTCTV